MTQAVPSNATPATKHAASAILNHDVPTEKAQAAAMVAVACELALFRGAHEAVIKQLGEDIITELRRCLR